MYMLESGDLMERRKNHVNFKDDAHFSFQNNFVERGQAFFERFRDMIVEIGNTIPYAWGHLGQRFILAQVQEIEVGRFILRCKQNLFPVMVWPDAQSRRDHGVPWGRRRRVLFSTVFWIVAATLFS